MSRTNADKWLSSRLHGRNLWVIVSVAALILLGFFCFLARDEEPRLSMNRFEGVVSIGPVWRAEYQGSDSNYEGLIGTTTVQGVYDGPYNFCHDVASEFQVGSAYRVSVKRVVHDVDRGNQSFAGTCLKIKDTEQISKNIDVAHISGHLEKITLDHHSYVAVLRLRTTSGELNVRMCNDGNRTGQTTLDQQLSQTDERLKKQTVFYNKADHSTRYDCYSVLAVRFDAIGQAWANPDAIRIFFPKDQAGALRKILQASGEIPDS